MANIKVSEMTQASSVNNADLLMIVQNSQNKKVTKQALLQDVNSNISAVEANITALQNKATELQTENNNLRKALPNIKGTGTDITLNNTSENKFNELVVKGNTEQDSYTGKNLLDGANPTGTNLATATMTGNTIKVSSTATNTTPFVRYEFNNVTEGDTYRLKGIIKNSIGRFVLQGYTTSWSTLITKDYVDGTSISSINYQIPANVTAIRFLLYSSRSTPSGAVESNYENVIVTKNNTDMTYEPYVGGIPSPNPDFPQQIKNVTGNVNVKIQNKNLLNLNNCTFNRCTLNNDGSVTCNMSDYYFPAIQTTSLNNYLLAHKGQNITFSIDKIITGKQISIVINGTLNGIANKTQEQTVSDSKSVTLNIANDFEKINYVQFRFNRSSTPFTDTTTVISEIMLEFGSTATQYTDHQEQNLPFTLGNIELNKIDTAQDYFYKKNGKWYKHEELSSIVFNGRENWANYTSSYDGRFYCTTKHFGTNDRFLNPSKFICSHFTPSSNTAIVNGIASTKFATYINIEVDEVNDVNTFKDWLSTHNTEVYYVKATPTETEITNITLINQLNAIKEAMSYYEQTNITSTAIIEANAVGDLNLILS